MSYLLNHDEWLSLDDLPELTAEERAALAEMPDDAVSHWRRGEKWDFAKNEWVVADS